MCSASVTIRTIKTRRRQPDFVRKAGPMPTKKAKALSRKVKHKGKLSGD